ncbi:hypothetical protein [Rufibacter ruber]|uniref:hypothetical protein n=1 Tax=Rufibacter ruber TaxID=1783499 RepID=UPI0012901416|nr:hypothetical protein [Rufibacter ruber]
MRKRMFAVLAVGLGLASCQQNQNASREEAAEDNSNQVAVALCEVTTTDSVTTQSWLVGEWELKGIRTNYMGSKEDEFLTGEQVGTPKRLTFFENGEYEERLDGNLQGERQPFKIVGQSLMPVGYQYWFCGERTLVISNVAADGVTEVYIKQ